MHILLLGSMAFPFHPHGINELIINSFFQFKLFKKTSCKNTKDKQMIAIDRHD